jgi:hypothetical protein
VCGKKGVWDVIALDSFEEKAGRGCSVGAGEGREGKCGEVGVIMVSLREHDGWGESTGKS